MMNCLCGSIWNEEQGSGVYKVSGASPRGFRSSSSFIRTGSVLPVQTEEASFRMSIVFKSTRKCEGGT